MCLKAKEKLRQLADEGIGEHQQQGDDEAVDTGRLGDGAAQQHGGLHGALALGLAADGLAGLADGVTFADTGADTLFLQISSPLSRLL